LRLLTSSTRGMRMTFTIQFNFNSSRVKILNFFPKPNYIKDWEVGGTII
jgi:hypothetical protein